ncbi:hypothetical protein EK904_014583, partial [Melospiza melodia maxima]
FIKCKQKFEPSVKNLCDETKKDYIPCSSLCSSQMLPVPAVHGTGLISVAQKKRKSNESVDTELCLNENALGKDNTAGVSTSHISAENSLAIPTSSYLSTQLTLMALALSLSLSLSSSVVFSQRNSSFHKLFLKVNLSDTCTDNSRNSSS